MADKPNVHSDLDAVFKIESLATNAGNRLILTGLLDTQAAVELYAHARQLAAAARDVAIDWHGVEQIGPAAVQVLLVLKNSLEAHGRKLEITSDNQGIRHLLELAGLAAALPAVPPKRLTVAEEVSWKSI